MFSQISLRSCKRSPATCMYLQPTPQKWTSSNTKCFVPDVESWSLANSHLVRTVCPCMPSMPITRLPSGGSVCKVIPLYQVPRAMDGQQIRTINWSLNGCVAPQHQMLSCSCSPASVYESANCLSVRASAMAWNAQKCVNYKPATTKQMKKRQL